MLRNDKEYCGTLDFCMGEKWIQRDYFEFSKVHCQNNRVFRTSLRLWSSAHAFFSQRHTQILFIKISELKLQLFHSINANINQCFMNLDLKFRVTHGDTNKTNVSEFKGFSYKVAN